VECEDFAGARLWIATVREARDNAGALIDEGQRLLVINPFELGSGVTGRLVLYGRDAGPGGLPAQVALLEQAGLAVPGGLPAQVRRPVPVSTIY
jgi:hypothetical protein